MADGSITIAALLDTGAFQASVTALEGQLANLSVRLQTAVTGAVAGSGIDGALEAIMGSLTGALDGLTFTASEAAQTAAQAAVLSFGSADWGGTGSGAAAVLTGGFTAGAGQIAYVAGQTAQNARNAFQGDWHAIGAGMTGNIAAGIHANAGSVVSAMASVAERAMAAAKEVLQIHSPSARMRDEVGMMLSRGIAEGILAGSGYIEAALAETGGRIHVPAVPASGGNSRPLQQNIYLRTGTGTPYQTARAIRQQSELMMRT
ncbi:MAG: hypothetical protein E7631_04535 [Ruminococcaceae bacterium]|nr:hypothetical protein [Oscillospiraceae bacterium]